jgi:hypothetical protein
VVTQTQQQVVTDRNQSLTVTATCATGTRVGGGGEVTDNDPQADHYAVMISSKPTGTAAWSVTGYTVIAFLAGDVMIVQSWVLCAS